MSNHHHQLWKRSNEHSSHENIYCPKIYFWSIDRPLSRSMYQPSLLLKKTRVWNPEPLENALRPLRNPVQMVWSPSVVPAKFSGLRCASYGAQAWDVHHHVSSAQERRYIVTFKLKFCVQKYTFESKSLSMDPSSCDDLKNWVLTYGAPEGWWAFHSPRV